MEKRIDLISRKALLAEYDRVHVGPPGGARKLMEDAPGVDAVEVVRCKDCKHFGGHGACHCHAADENGTPIFVREEDFCSYGERRTDGSEG